MVIVFHIIGGSGADAGSSIAVDAAGNAYIAGTATSIAFPTANPLSPNSPTQTLCLFHAQQLARFVQGPGGFHLWKAPQKTQHEKPYLW
jgi:hypothetical protein